MVVVDQKLKKRSKKMSREQSNRDNSIAGTEDMHKGGVKYDHFHLSRISGWANYVIH